MIPPPDPILAAIQHWAWQTIPIASTQHETHKTRDQTLVIKFPGSFTQQPCLRLDMDGDKILAETYIDKYRNHGQPDGPDTITRESLGERKLHPADPDLFQILEELATRANEAG